MNNLELVSYQDYPQDQYTKAVCIVCIDNKYVVAYGKKVTKEGKEWWQSASMSVTKDGVKQFIDGFCLDSKKENEKILDFVRSVEKGQQPTSMSEVAPNDGLPF